MVAHGRSNDETDATTSLMFQSLTSPSLVRAAQLSIAALFAQHAEWFCSIGQGETHALHRDEIDFAILQNRLVVTCWTDRGSRSWPILGWYWNGQVLSLQVSRRMGGKLLIVDFIPRASALSISATIRAARQVRCDLLARLAVKLPVDAMIERSALSPGVRRGQPGKYARILLRDQRQRIAVTALVVPSRPSAVDAYLASTLLWFRRTAERIRPPYIEQLWLIVSNELLRPTLNRIALLRESLKRIIKIFLVDDDLRSLKPIASPDRAQLWKKKLARFPPVVPAGISHTIQRMISLAPEAIDVVHARHGETIRYLGLPFARVRSVLGVPQVWFGVEGTHRCLLDEASAVEFRNLINDLIEHRSAKAVDHKHALYHSAPEAWLESLLRHDITKLDPGLIIAPLHAQFRTARGGTLGSRPIDMLALRRDGRLVVIELKVSEDREHVLQGADYWRRVEAHRRRGHISKARLFGDRAIKDESPLVYLVAPTLRVHPSFQILARLIASDIEIYRFDINEDWRAGVRVMRRLKAN